MRSATLELSLAAAFAKEVIYFSNLVQHGPVDDTLELAFISFSQLSTLFVDGIAHFLTIFDEFVGVGLILAIFHDLLCTENMVKNVSCMHFGILDLLARVMTLAINVRRLAGDFALSIRMKRFLMKRSKLTSQCLK